MALLTKQAILNADDIRTEDVPVPEWGGDVRVKAMTGRERDAFEASLIVGEGKKRKPDMANVRAKLIAHCAIDETGAKLFTTDEIALLGRKSSAALDRVFAVCQRLSGLSEADINELEKKSEADPSADSASTSASSSATHTPTDSSST